MFKTLLVASHQRVAHVVDGRYTELLGPGRHTRWTLGGLHEFLTLDLRAEVDKRPNPDPLPDDLPGATTVRVASNHRGVLFFDGVYQKILYPGRYLLWDAQGKAEVYDVDVQAEPLPLPDTDRTPHNGGNVWTDLTVDGTTAGVVKHNGVPIRLAAPGRYRVWSQGPWTIEPVSLALATVDVEPQDLLTRDQVPVRLKAGVTVRVTDALQRAREVDRDKQIYAAVHHAMREVVSARELEPLLADRAAVDAELQAAARARLPAVGVALEQVVLRDVILPGEVKELFNRVTLARKEAEALAIKRREETAQTRQLANTARLLDNNPVLLRLKELEGLAELAGRIDRLTVVGGGDLVKGVMLSEMTKVEGGEG